MKKIIAMKTLFYRTDCHSNLLTGIIHSWSSWECVLGKMMILAIDLEDVKNIPQSFKHTLRMLEAVSFL